MQMQRHWMEKERMERAVRQPLTKEEALVGWLSSGGFVRDKRVTQTKSARDPMKGSSFFFNSTLICVNSLELVYTSPPTTFPIRGSYFWCSHEGRASLMFQRRFNDWKILPAQKWNPSDFSLISFGFGVWSPLPVACYLFLVGWDVCVCPH